MKSVRLKCLPAYLFALFAVLLLSACSSTPKQPVVLPSGSLNADQLNALFVNQTVVSKTVAKGRISTTYYDPNGRIRQSRQGVKRFGQWRITDDARICLKMGYYDREKCRIVVQQGGQYTKYIVKQDGNHVPVVTYESFTPGNPSGL